MKVQPYNPKYLCEYVDPKLYARKGMHVIGNFHKKLECIDTGLTLNSSMTIIGKGLKCLYNAIRWVERQLQTPRFKLPKNNVVEMKDLPSSIVFEGVLSKPRREKQLKPILVA